MPNADFFALLRMFVRRGFFDAALCAQLRNEIRSVDRTAATVRRQGSVYAVDPQIRSAQWGEVSRSSISLVESRLLALQQEVARHFDLALAGCQPPQFLAYRPGDFYRPHRDSSSEPDAARRAKERRVSVIIFLNSESGERREDSYGGGSLTFYGLLSDSRSESFGLPLAGEEGLLIAFRSEIVHEVTPVTDGERYTIASWYF